MEFLLLIVIVFELIGYGFSKLVEGVYNLCYEVVVDLWAIGKFLFTTSVGLGIVGAGVLAAICVLAHVFK